MGIYIEVRDHRHRTGKAGILVEEIGARFLSVAPLSITDIPEDEVAICVVENVIFDACMVCYEQYDFDRVHRERSGGDDRKVVWLSAKREVVLPRLRPEHQRRIREAWGMEDE